MMEVWAYCAPEIDIIAPDIYVPDFVGICDEYTRRNAPLFIPECATHSYAGPRQVYCVGHYHALCYSPFGFEDMGQPFSDTQSYLFGVDVEDPALKTPMNVEEYAWYNRTLNEMMPLLAAKYGTNDLQAVSYPMRIPEGKFDPWSVKPEWMLLSYKKPVTASSTAEGSDTELAADENARTWWSAAAAGEDEWICMDLEKEADVRAIQVNLADEGLAVEYPEEKYAGTLGEGRYIE